VNAFDLDGRVVVVTGALGRLGRQFVTALAAAGARVAALDILPAPPGDDKHFVGADRVRYFRADVTARASLENALTEITAVWDAPYGLINNAAIDAPPDSPLSDTGPFEGYSEKSWDRMLEVNLKGPFLCCQVFGQAMAAAGRGSIVNICSIYGVVSPDQRIYDYRRTGHQAFHKPVAYSVSKSGLLNFTRYLATYWARQGVRVNTLTLAGVYDNQDERFLQNYSSRIPIGRMANPDEYNGAVVFLCSDASSYMTGSNLVIDGGWTAW
jgi:NAD(P)-dependent dehydrogenase (short-subunit alcohol dehydrogenase family)